MRSDFWRPRLTTQRETLVPFAFERTRPGVEHLQAARDFLAGKKVEGHRPHRFIDSDLYKVMEGAAYLLQLRRDPELEARLDELANLIAAAQHENGYLYPSHTTGVGSSRNMMGDAPYTFVVHSHELYNVGHLYEAAIAYYRATGKDRLLEVAEKSAQHINRVFFVGDPDYNGGNPIRQAPGHQEIELALVKLFRVTGKKLYLDMARKFLEVRGVTYVPDGEGVMAPTYAQQHAPVVEQTQAVGHAVRATYLYSAMADVGTLTGDARYARALDRIWADITNTRMHITGGLGAVHGIEGFGPQYELPNADAFNETCAAVGNVLFNYRMFLLHKDARYLDVAEVALLNNVLAAVNLEGNRFFYVNPLEADGKYPFNHGTAGRAPWFGTACCPSNMARLIPQVPGMTYAHDDHNLYITFYADSRTRIDVGGVRVDVEQRTRYPEDGKIRVVVRPERPARFRLLLRIPTWTRDRFVPGELYRYVDSSDEPVLLSVNGDRVAIRVDRGFASIDREWHGGDRVLLNLPVPIRVSECHEAVKSNENRVALTRGPFVLCAEGIDNGGVTQRYFLEKLPETSNATVSSRRTDSGSFIQVRIPASALTRDGETESASLVLTPYYAWNNRGVSSMTIWFPRDKSLAVYDPHALPRESAFARITASHTAPVDTVSAIGDGKEPRWSSGKRVPRWTSRPQKGRRQWVEARFHETRQLRSVGVYWMQDRKDVWFPREWSLEVEQNGAWKPFELDGGDRYETRANRYNVVQPASPLRCDAIRIRILPREDACVGILEVKVTFEEPRGDERNLRRQAGDSSGERSARKLRVFVLAGQSNMEGQGVVDLDHPQHYNGGRGTLEWHMRDPAKASRYKHLRDEHGNWVKRDDVWVRFKTARGLKKGPLSIGYSGYPGRHHIGPELQFGHVVGDRLEEPVLLIKTAWGGKSLHRDFRPPGSGGETGPYYRKMLEEVREALAHLKDDFPAHDGAEPEIAGFVWFQGWNDMFDADARASYEQNLVNLIRDVRREFGRPDLPVVIGELGNGGKKAGANMLAIRNAQAAAAARPEFRDTVAFVETTAFARPREDSPNRGHGHHWFGNAESYFLIGDALGQQMIRLLETSTATSRARR